MTSASVEIDAPLAVRLWAWVRERFPPSMWILYMLVHGAALTYGRSMSTTGSLGLGSVDLLGFAAVLSMFLLVRVIDEHKDFEDDGKKTPWHVLQRGVVTLTQLKIIGAVAFGLQTAAVLRLDGGVGRITSMWLICLAYLALMSVEFFCPRWLKRHFLLYSLLHLFSLPVALAWMAQMGAGQRSLPVAAVWLALHAFFAAAAFELMRKTVPPAREQAGVATFSAILGVPVATMLILIMLLLSLVSLAFIVHTIAPVFGLPWYLAAALLYGMTIVLVARFRSAADEKNWKRGKIALSISLLAAHLLIIAAVLHTRGVLWI